LNFGKKQSHHKISPKKETEQTQRRPEPEINGSKGRNYRRRTKEIVPVALPGNALVKIKGELDLVKKRISTLYFLETRFLGAARVGCGAVVLVTRPDLVLVRTLGCSTIAGAWNVG